MVAGGRRRRPTAAPLPEPPRTADYLYRSITLFGMDPEATEEMEIIENGENSCLPDTLGGFINVRAICVYWYSFCYSLPSVEDLAVRLTTHAILAPISVHAALSSARLL